MAALRRLGIGTLAVLFLVAAWMVLEPGGCFFARRQFTTRDVADLVDSFGLDHRRVVAVVHGYQSPLSGPGDYLDAWAIRMDAVSESDLPPRMLYVFGEK